MGERCMKTEVLTLTAAGGYKSTVDLGGVTVEVVVYT